MVTNGKYITRASNVATADKQVAVTQPGMLAYIKWIIIRGLFATIGRLSQGMRIGYRCGFASGIMLDYVYANQEHGSLGIGKLLDRLYLDAPGWHAMRSRSALLKRMLRKRVEYNRISGEVTHLLDIASGPGRYLQELAQELHYAQGNLQILCRDVSLADILQGAKQAEEADLNCIHYELGDAFNPAPTETQLGGAPNVIVVSGLYELLQEDEVIRQSLAELCQMTEPGGALYFTTQTRDFSMPMLSRRNATRLVVKCRPVAQIEDWARDAGFSLVQSQREASGFFTITKAQKLQMPTFN